MCTFIGIESVTANAFIELLEKQNKMEVSFDTLVRYGMQVGRILQEKSNDEPVLLFSRKYQINMLENYSDFFEADLSYGSQRMFRLKCKNKQKTLHALTTNFRWTMGMPLLEAFMSIDALHELGINP
ncbi:hypothetical protein D7V94_18230 [Parablautia intestinalis]|jgi:hypothetical protein|uniref:Uncharacterized protein n=1 Tax=Parablautia intestinalis TaxID=2320100 RepID=A0A3A9APC4_9FIRM|nr:hypothetical protein [Parablautia intestinalis]MCI8616105.1 hypothetical protein [Lachnospiraceae bacterium]RKI89393.1 hypothetical protein D7V94_18230 [Parablautia intestinalis]